MLKDCIEIFKKEYEKPGVSDRLITDNYTLDPGTYILVDNNGQISNLKEVEKKDFSPIGFEDFIQKDYLSKLIAMNKPIDVKKVIHSNNYLSFWVKKDNIAPDSSGKLNPNVIENYYNILSSPDKKYRGKSLELYKKLEQDLGSPDEEKLRFCKSWIEENIFSLLERYDIKVNKNYLKIFFIDDDEIYRQENKRYLLPNIYNSTDYNVLIEDHLFGLPNNNMGMNAKKPYLENKGRLKSKIPYLISTEEAYLQQKFFDYLYNYANQGKTNIYLNDSGIFPCDRNKAPEHNFKGYYLRIQKGLELEIRDYDLITGFSPKLNPPLVVEPIVPFPENNKSEFIYKGYDDLFEVQNIINITFFKKFLANNYFTDPKDIKLNDFRVKEALLQCRNGFFTWFYKGNSEIVKALFPKAALTLIKNAIANGSFVRAIEQFNLYFGFIMYFEGGKNMADQYRLIEKCLREKMNSEGNHFIESDPEYYFAVGQLTNYYLSKNRSGKPVHSIVNPILNCSNDSQLKELLMRLFKKYNYDIEPRRRFNTLQSMVLRYQPETEIIGSVPIIAGYLSPSLIYESSKNIKSTGGKSND